MWKLSKRTHQIMFKGKYIVLKQYPFCSLTPTTATQEGKTKEGENKDWKNLYFLYKIQEQLHSYELR